MKTFHARRRLLWLISVASSCCRATASAEAASPFGVTTLASSTRTRRIQRPSSLRVHVCQQQQHDAAIASLLQMRGGGWAPRRQNVKNPNNRTKKSQLTTTATTTTTTTTTTTLRKVLPWAGAAAVISLLFIEYAENINAYITSLKPEWLDMEAFKAKLLETLTDINEKGGPKGLALYVVFLSLWAACGLTTIPVESSAGMAFGWRKGLILNAMGKMSGSLLAYAIGRIFLEEAVVSKLEDNEIFGLVDQAVTRRPYGTSVMVRFFPFPELVKNLALSILPPVQLGVFVAATFTHTFPFTLLWTWLGCDTVAHMRDDTLAPNKVLAAVLLGVTAFGVFGSPALAALFVRSMKLEHDRAVAEKK